MKRKWARSLIPVSYTHLDVYKRQTYNYDDAAWDAYVQEQGGTLNYK